MFTTFSSSYGTTGAEAAADVAADDGADAAADAPPTAHAKVRNMAPSHITDPDYRRAYHAF